MLISTVIYFLHSRKLTWTLKLIVWKRNFFARTGILGLHVSFWGFIPLYLVKLMQFLEHIFFTDMWSLYQPTRLHYRKWTAETRIWLLSSGDFFSSIWWCFKFHFDFQGCSLVAKKSSHPSKQRSGLKCFSADELRLEAVLEALLGMNHSCFASNLLLPQNRTWQRKKTSFEYVSPIKTDEFPLPC